MRMRLFDVFTWNEEKFNDPAIETAISQGGTYSGKTVAIEQLFFRKGVEFAKVGRKAEFSTVGVTIPHLKRGALRDFESILNETGAIRDIEYNKTDKTFKLGSVLWEFFSAENEGKVKGGKRDYLFINEADLIDWTTFSQLSMRTRIKTFIDYNPTAAFWVHQKIKGAAGVAFGISNYLNNPTTPQKIINELERLKEVDPELYRVYGLGLTGNIKGLIFKINVVPEMPPDLKRESFGLDFGFTNDPSTLIRLGLSGGELYLDEIFYERGLINRIDPRRPEVNSIEAELKKADISRTATIIADSADPKSIKALSLAGYNIRGAVKGRDSIRAGIARLKQYKINVTRRSVNIRKEAASYKWKTDRDGNSLNVPIEFFNHTWDAARYGSEAVVTTRDFLATN